MFPANCFVIFKNGTRMLIENAMPEIERLGAPERRKIPPAIAIITYKTFPMFIMIGPKLLAYA